MKVTPNLQIFGTNGCRVLSWARDKTCRLAVVDSKQGLPSDARDGSLALKSRVIHQRSERLAQLLFRCECDRPSGSDPERLVAMFRNVQVVLFWH